MKSHVHTHLASDRVESCLILSCMWGPGFSWLIAVSSEKLICILSRWKEISIFFWPPAIFIARGQGSKLVYQCHAQSVSLSSLGVPWCLTHTQRRCWHTHTQMFDTCLPWKSEELINGWKPWICHWPRSQYLTDYGHDFYSPRGPFFKSLTVRAGRGLRSF